MKKSIAFKFSQHEIGNLFETDAFQGRKHDSQL